MSSSTIQVPTPERALEDGFTLVEILVVIIIIGILAAIAIPIFLNQQRAARDAATIQDSRNLVTNIETAKATIPQPTGISVHSNSAHHEHFTLIVTSEDDSLTVKGTKTAGTRLNAYLLPDGENYHVTAWNRDGQEYTGTKPGEAVLVYDSAKGKNITWKYS